MEPKPVVFEFEFDFRGSVQLSVEIVPGHQSACFAGERQEKRGLK